MTLEEVGKKIPHDAVVAQFGAIMAISPEWYDRMITEFAAFYGVPVDDTRAYVQHELEGLEPFNDF